MKHARIDRSVAGLLVIDLQERLWPVVHERELVRDNAVRLIRGAAQLRVPTWVTEQYPKGLGPTIPEVAEALAGLTPIEKITFSACGVPVLPESLAARGVRDVVLCGLETHVCVTQTCLDLLASGMNVFVVSDAVSSRTAANRQAGLERMRQAGATWVSSEMILFELLERAGTDEFKRVQALIR